MSNDTGILQELNTLAENGTADLDELLLQLEKHRVLTTDKIPPPETAIKMFPDEDNTDDYDIIGTRGNFTVVTGKAKSKKTFFISVLIAALITDKAIFRTFAGALPPQQRKVLYFDTEQSKFHVQRVLNRVCKLAGITNPTDLIVYSLRSEPTEKRLQFIKAKIYNTENLGAVFIDGIRDIAFDINDSKEASDVAGLLLKWTEELNVFLLTVLHQNKGDSNARGHLGTELINKAETVLAVERINNSEISTVTPTQTRNREPQPFAFAIDTDGLPYKTRIPQSEGDNRESFDPEKIDAGQLQELFYTVFKMENFNPVGYDDLINQTKLIVPKILGKSLGINNLKTVIKFARNENIILQPEELKKGNSRPNILCESVKQKYSTV